MYVRVRTYVYYCYFLKNESKNFSCKAWTGDSGTAVLPLIYRTRWKKLYSSRSSMQTNYVAE